MDNNAIQIIKEKFDSLPESIKKLIMSSHYEDTLIEIGQKNQLNVEQMGILERETTMVMMGLTSTTSFEVDLTRELDVDRLKGSQIVKEINEKIFIKIRELLKLMNTPVGEEPSLEEEEEETSVSDEHKEEPQNDILKSAGIEILPTTIPGEKAHNTMPAQKLSGSFQIPATKTDYSVENLSKSSPKKITPIPIPTIPIPTPPKSYPPKADPYREIPE